MRRAVPAIVAALLFAVPGSAHAQSKTISAATCNAADVQRAIGQASAGDTVLIPAGTCTWSTTVTWTAPANTTLRGAGNESIVGGGDATVIIDDLNRQSYDAGVLEISVNSTGTFRLMGLTVRPSGNAYAMTSNGHVRISGDNGAHLRIDHVHLDRPNLKGILTGGGKLYGVIDHTLCDMAYAGVCMQYFATSWGGGDHGDGSWSDGTTLGSERFIYVEDNVINGNGVGGVQDSYLGSRFVIRYNTINRAATQTHPTGGSGRGRGTRAWEIYGNTFTAPTSGGSEFNMFFLSSGTGVIWGNTTTGYTNFVTIHNKRTTTEYPQSPTPAGWGYCGTAVSGVASAWDQNTDSTGWACIDQPGRGAGDLLSGEFPNAINTRTRTIAWPQQTLEPVYEWTNSWTPVPGGGGNFWAVYHVGLQPNRDFYLYTTSFNGSSGTGAGTLASRPSTCTTGVAYWAADAGGNWNTANGSSNDGALYKCTAANTWTLYYTPYTYPHPLTRGAIQTTPPAAPTSLSIIK
jgi:hypothetical protein